MGSILRGIGYFIVYMLLCVLFLLCAAAVKHGIWNLELVLPIGMMGVLTAVQFKFRAAHIVHPISTIVVTLLAIGLLVVSYPFLTEDNLPIFERRILPPLPEAAPFSADEAARGDPDILAQLLQTDEALMAVEQNIVPSAPPILRDLHDMNRYLRTLSLTPAYPWRYFFAIGALCLFATSLMVCTVLTRWSLVNVAAAILAFRLLIWSIAATAHEALIPILIAGGAAVPLFIATGIITQIRRKKQNG